MSRIAACSICCALVALSARVHAEPPPDNKQQEADRLFQQGLESMRAGAYEVACPELAQSYRIDPSPGALFTLAECEAGWHKLASALTDYQSFVSALTAMSAERRVIEAVDLGKAGLSYWKITMDNIRGTHIHGE